MEDGANVLWLDTFSLNTWTVACFLGVMFEVFGTVSAYGITGSEFGGSRQMLSYVLDLSALPTLARLRKTIHSLDRFSQAPRSFSML